MNKTEKAIENLNTAKLTLCNPQMLTPEMCIKIGQTITNAIDLLKEQKSVIEALKSDLDETLAVLGEQAELVRCGDCINCVKEPNGDLYCDVLAIGYEPLGSKKVNGDWFCADGERKD